MSGEDVTALQAILAADPSIYPEGTISGFYGRLTAEAVKKFQKKHGFEQVGFVGPKTLKKLNEEFRKLGLSFEIGTSTASTTTIIVTNNGKAEVKGNKLCIPPGHMIAPGWLKKHDKPVPTSSVPLCNSRGNDRDDDDDNHGTTTPDTIAPIISSITTVPGQTNATVYWTTNENSTTKVYYGTTSSIDVNATTTLSVSNGSLVSNHGITVTGLTAATTYYYVVESKDASGNKAVSSVSSFVISAIPDTTAPQISAVGTLNLMGTTTSIIWTTNEASNSKVWFGTSSPVSTSGAANISDSAMVTSHSLPLTGLATSTTYYYVVGSTDAANNSATSSQSSFLTTADL
jgi:peptidoglycan hydrolase-like protein with peptidoglycan-binding domain